MSDGSMEYEYTPVMPQHASPPYSSGPPPSRISRCPYAAASQARRHDPWPTDSARLFTDLHPTYTPAWHPPILSAHQRWPPLGLGAPQPPVLPNLDSGPASPGSWSTFHPPAPPSASAPVPRSPNSNPPPSSSAAGATRIPSQDHNPTPPTPSSQDRVPATQASLGTPLGLGSSESSAGPSSQPTPASSNAVAFSQPVSVRLPVPTGPLHSRTTTFPGPSSARPALSAERHVEYSNAAADGSGPSTSGSDDDSDMDLGGPQLSVSAYAHSTRQSQILRGQMTQKRVASKKAIESLEKVDPATLSENERSCVICYNDFGMLSPEGSVEMPLRLPKCKHVFGSLCIRKWLQDSYSCPYCRDKLESVPAKPNEAVLRRMLQAAGEPEILMTNTRLRRMIQTYASQETPSERLFRRRRGDNNLDDTTPSRREGATRGERRALPTDQAEVQRRQRPRHDVLHASRPPLPEPSFFTANRHGSSTTATSHPPVPPRDHSRFGAWQDPNWRPAPPAALYAGPYTYTASRNQPLPGPVPHPSISLPQLHTMGLSYPPPFTDPYHSQLPPASLLIGGQPHNTFQPPSTSSSTHTYYPSGYVNSPLHPPPMPGREFQFPPLTSLPLTDPPPYMPLPEHTLGNAHMGANQSLPSVTQPERNHPSS